MKTRVPTKILRPANAPNRPLSELAASIGVEVRGTTTGVAVSGVSLATGDLRPGDVFFAIRGVNGHGAQYAAAAVAAGAAAILTDSEGADIAGPLDVPVLVVRDPRSILGTVSAWVYRTEVSTPILLAITGTNGKTSTAHLLDGILQQMDVLSGLSSTAERHIAGEVLISGLTTPEAPEMHALLAVMRERHVEAAALEVSAQAVTRHRVDGLIFHVTGFTSLTHDHLDDYGDMETYFAAKRPLFTPERSQQAVICVDTASGTRMTQLARVPFVTVGTPSMSDQPEVSEAADWVVTIDAEHQRGTTFTLRGPEGQTLTTLVPVIGEHMAANAALAIVMIVRAGYPFERIANALHRDGQINAHLPGRTELVSGDRGPAVYVDFGHTPDAFAKTLRAVRRVTDGRVLMLFGADGDRDATKRFDMSREAAENSDILIVTDHHPRFEDAASIRKTLVDAARQVRPDGEVYEFSPPERAIVAAVGMVGEGDAILWAGPGHQNYRDIEGVQTAYSARELARRALKAAGWPVPEPRWVVPYPPDD